MANKQPFGAELDVPRDHPRLPTRRQVISSASIALALGASGIKEAVANGLAAEEVTDGYFLVFPDSDRVFFVPSVWLEVFEVTDLFRSGDLTNNVEKIRRYNRSAKRKKKMDALYINLVMDERYGAYKPYPSEEVKAPSVGAGTYLAMSIAPADIDNLPDF
jgi:hypothetical protein